MNTSDNNAYNPADDDNQGVVQLMAQGQEASPGVSQYERINPVKASGPEPEKAEVNENTDDEGLNDDITAEEDVENGEADTADE
ncbi:hypothetical protein [Spirosoma validum]|uniref:Uncharacterized protein n=1 Tax=Spirosoma validum TaxID=2771355 RepID=A0A927AYQ8_9BACT|nr:hypothetical protein [Spirosoma validum]MBD2752315.1 hypothetical protein [Spirosoma validum]